MAGAGEPRRIPGERLSERLVERKGRRAQSAHVSSFFSRFGLVDPMRAPAGAGGGAPDGYVYISGRPFYDLLARLQAWEQRREERFGLHLGAGGKGGWSAFRRLSAGKPQIARAALALSSLGSGDLTLIQPETQMPPAAEGANAEELAPVRRSAWFRREPKVRAKPRKIRALPVPARTPRTPSWQREQSTAAAVPLRPVPTAAAPRPLQIRRVERAETVGRTSALQELRPVLRNLERIARTAQTARAGARVQRLANELRQSAPRQWSSQIREALREIDVEDVSVAAAVVAAMPDTYTRPMTLALARSAAPDERARGLRTATGRSPMLRALAEPEAPSASRHARAAAARAPGRRSVGSKPVPVRRGTARRALRAAPAARASGSSDDAGPAPSRVGPSVRPAFLQHLSPLRAEQAPEGGTPEAAAAEPVARRARPVRGVATAHVAGRLFGENASATRWSQQLTPTRRTASTASAATAATADRRSSGSRAVFASPPLLARLDSRGERSAKVGLPQVFYERLGFSASTADPALADRVPSASPPSAESSGSLVRLAAAQRRRTERQAHFEARHEADRLPVAARRWPGEPVAAARIRTLGVDDLLLPKAAPPAEPMAETPATPVPAFSTRRTAAVATPRAVASRVAAPAAQAPLLKTRRRVAPVAGPMSRAGERLEVVSADPVIRALEEVARSNPSAVVARVASAAMAAIARTPQGAPERARIVREAISRMGPVVRAQVPEVEAALPDAASRPAAVAGGRLDDARAEPRGLRPVMNRSPSLQELRPAPVEIAAPAEPVVSPAARTRAPVSTSAPAPGRAARVAPTRIAASRAASAVSSRLSASPVSRPGARRVAPAVSLPVDLAERPSRLAEPSVGAREQAPALAPRARSARRASPEAAPLNAAHRAADRLDLGEVPGSVLPQTSPLSQRAGVPGRAGSRASAPLSPPSRLGAFAPDQQLLVPARIVPETSDLPEAPATAARPPSAARIPATPRPSARPRHVAAPPAGAFVPTALLAALRADEAAPETGPRVGALARAATRFDLDETAAPASRSALPSVAPREERPSFSQRPTRGVSSLVPTLLSARPEAEASPVDESVPATRRPAPAITASRRAVARLVAERAPSSSLVPRPVATDTAAPSATARRTTAFAAGQRAERPVGVGMSVRRALAPEPTPGLARAAARGPVAYARTPAGVSLVLPAAPAPAPSEAQTTETTPRFATVGRAASTLRSVAARASALDRAAGRPEAAPEAAASTLRSPASASAGVVRLYAEARAVEEVLRGLSRGPRADANRRVSASARQILDEVMAGAGGRTASTAPSREVGARSMESVRASRLALTEVFSLLTQVSAVEPKAEAAPAAEPVHRRSRPLEAARRLATAERGEQRGDRAERAPTATRRLSRLGLYRSLYGLPMSLAQQERPAPQEGLPESEATTPVRGRRLPTRARLGRRARVAESFFLADAPVGAAEGGATPAGPRRAGFNQTLDAVDSGQGTQGLPSWAQRTTGRRAGVTATAGSLLDALHAARGPGEVIAAVNRQAPTRDSARTLPTPVLRLLDEIRAEAAASLESASSSSEASSAGGGARQGSRTAGPRPVSTTRVFSGFTNINRMARAKTTQGVGEDRLMKLTRRLQSLIFLAEGRKADAMKEVRLAEDSAAARAEGQAAPTQSGDAKASQVDVDALAQEVLQVVQRELEARSERRAEDPENKTPWW